VETQEPPIKASHAGAKAAAATEDQHTAPKPDVSPVAKDRAEVHAEAHAKADAQMEARAAAKLEAIEAKIAAARRARIEIEAATRRVQRPIASLEDLIPTEHMKAHRKADAMVEAKKAAIEAGHARAKACAATADQHAAPRPDEDPVTKGRAEAHAKAHAKAEAQMELAAEAKLAAIEAKIAAARIARLKTEAAAGKQNVSHFPARFVKTGIGSNANPEVRINTMTFACQTSLAARFVIPATEQMPPVALLLS